MKYDSLLVVSFGGPEGPDDVIPFLENVLRGKNVPRRRMMEVAEHYAQFGGVSPINDQNRALVAALRDEFAREGLDLPVFWGNRNWHPLLADTLREMRDAGHRRTLAFMTSAYSSYSGCRQYREDIIRAQSAVGDDAPSVDKLRVFYNHPGFIESLVDRLHAARAKLPRASRGVAEVAYTAHSIPCSMADHCDYVAQLRETATLVSEAAGIREWSLVYQSRSGPPQQPWLEPDIGIHLESRFRAGLRDIIVAPIGFISDHLEVKYDLDLVARRQCDAMGLNMIRAGTAGTHPVFVRMIRQLVEERQFEGRERLASGSRGAGPDVCPLDCCPLAGNAPGQASS